MPVPTEVFLSHSSQDHVLVERIAEVIRRHGVPTWYSATNILGAQQWHDEIGAALQRCDWFVLALTSRSVESMWVKRELMFALQQKRFENKIIPLLLEPCELERLSWVLSSFQVIDFRPDEAEGFRALFRTWGLGYDAARSRQGT